MSRSIAVPLNERKPLFLTGDEIREIRDRQRRQNDSIVCDALRDAVGFIDRLQANKGDWTVAEVKRIEEIRLLSLGI